MGKLLADFARGLRAYVAVVPLFGKLGLWRYVGITVAVSLGIFLLLLPLSLLITQSSLSFWETHVTANPLLRNVLWFATEFIVLSIELLLFKRMVLVAASPWMGVVAARVEAHLLGAPVPEVPLSRKLMARALRLNLRLAWRELLFSLPLFVGMLVPVLGLLATMGLLLVQAFFVGAGALDYTLERRLGYGETLAFLNRRRGLAAGLGAGFVAMLFLLVGFLVAPVWSAAAGAYALHRDGLDAIVDLEGEQYLRPTL